MKLPAGIPVFGDLTFRDKKCPFEVAEQVTFFNQLRAAHPDTFGLIAVHVRNEGKKTPDQARREKAEGMAAGSPDIMIPGNPSFLCELKRKDHVESKLQPMQVPYLMASQKAGSYVCIAFGWVAAMEAFNHWRLNINKPGG